MVFSTVALFIQHLCRMSVLVCHRAGPGYSLFSVLVKAAPEAPRLLACLENTGDEHRVPLTPVSRILGRSRVLAGRTPCQSLPPICIWQMLYFLTRQHQCFVTLVCFLLAVNAFFALQDLLRRENSEFGPMVRDPFYVVSAAAR